MSSGQTGSLDLGLVGGRGLAFSHLAIHLSQRARLIGRQGYRRLISRETMSTMAEKLTIWMVKILCYLLASFLRQACHLPLLSVSLLLCLCSFFEIQLRRVGSSGLHLGRNELGGIWLQFRTLESVRRGHYV